MAITRRNVVAGAGAIALTAPAWAQAAPAARTLSNAKASARARTLYDYLWSIYGRRTLTGQQEGMWSADEGALAELNYLQRTTGKLPAVLGLDYIDPDKQQAVNGRAIDWYEAGGIPTLCWHWGAPDIGTGYENSKKDFDLSAALRPGTPQHAAMWRDLDHVADLLTELRDRNVPVLWRPLHEFSGDWFWWGKHGADGFKALWTLMYDHYVGTRGLNNLIWVLGWAGQNVDPAYYPGRDRVDIAGADIYVDDHGNLAPMFAKVKAIVGDTLPITLHENGPVPDPALLGPGADWLYFMTWHTRWLTDPVKNPPEDLKRWFNSARYLVRDELPRLKGA